MRNVKLSIVSSLLLSMVIADFALAMNVSSRAKHLAKKYLIVDTHIDTPYRLNNKWQDVTQANLTGNFDYQKAKDGGLNASFMSVYVPTRFEQQGKGYGVQLAHQQIDSVEAIAARAPDKFALAYSTADLKTHFNRGVISLALGMESGTPLANNLNNLTMFYQRGIRYVTLAHTRTNHIADSAYDSHQPWQGLSPFGKELIVAMNQIGMLIDISHASKQAFFQTLEISQTPVVVSSSSLGEFTPDFQFKLDETKLKALSDKQGLVLINFSSLFVTGESLAVNPQIKSKVTQATPNIGSSIGSVLDHIQQVTKLVGVEYVAIGSNFDGVGDALPPNLKDVSYYPALIQGLLQRGYSQPQINNILSGNFIRVWQRVETFAHQNR